ncbi:MAG TPA: OB-fold nucleic acid binding domain-containing protein [archaeon]|nr:OB-fold nucleic acid binding domain-containing protein [archaeon]
MKDKVVLLSFVISIVGLIAIYLLSHNAKPEYLSISQLTTNLVGKIVSTGGFIESVSYNTAGHVFLKIGNENKSIQVALFSDFMKSLNAENTSYQDLSKGKHVNITGILDIYNNQLQIIPRKTTDFKIS